MQAEVLGLIGVCDFRDDGRFYTFISSWNCQKIAAARTGSTDHPLQYKSHLPGHSPPTQAGRTPCWASAIYGLRPMCVHMLE
jgi:hypothetical protein